MIRKLAIALLLLAFPAAAQNLVTNAAGNLAVSTTGNLVISTTGLNACGGTGATYSYNLVTDFGGVSGGTTTQNNTAFAAFNTQAQRLERPTETGYAGGANGAGNPLPGASGQNCVVLNIPAGTFAYTQNTWGKYIPRLKIVGAGSGSTSLQNQASSGGEQAEEPYYTNTDYFGVPDGAGQYGYFINTATAGATSVTLAGSASNASNFTPGRWVLIWSYEQQYSGVPSGSSSYPPNTRYYDFAKVVSANTSTGIITFDTPLSFTHLSTRPYAGTLTDGPTGTWGPARITPIDTPAKPVGLYQEIDGVRFLTNPNFNNLTADCFQSIGLIDESINDVTADQCFSFSQLRNATVSNSTWVFDEADKIVNDLVYDDDAVGSTSTSGSGTYNHAGELLWHVIGGSITNWSSCCAGINIGARTVLIEGGTVINGLTKSGGFNGGISLDDNWQTVSVTVNGATFQGASISSTPPFTAPQSTNKAITIDGTSVISTTGPNGANTRLQIVGQPNGSNTSETVNDNWGDGNQVWENGNFVAGCTVSSITGDAGNVYVDATGCTFPTSGTVWVAKAQSLTVENSVGSSTGYSWTSPNLSVDGIIHYPNGTHAIPSITWSGNSGN